jgi:GDPmannose 4,6-dehydratase
MHLMLQQDEPDDYVIATGVQHSVRDFVLRAFTEVGIKVRFEGEGSEEVGVVDAVDLPRLSAARRGELAELLDAGPALDTRPALIDGEGPVPPGSVVLRIDPRYFRPTEVESLIGDPSKARERLGWQATTTFEELVAEMVADDLVDARRDELLNSRGFAVRDFRE